MPQRYRYRIIGSQLRSCEPRSRLIVPRRRYSELCSPKRKATVAVLPFEISELKAFCPLFPPPVWPCFVCGKLCISSSGSKPSLSLWVSVDNDDCASPLIVKTTFARSCLLSSGEYPSHIKHWGSRYQGQYCTDEWGPP